MKGLVFTEFFNLVEDSFGEEVSDQIIEDSIDELSTEGSYTSVGNYDYKELVSLVVSLSQRTKLPIPSLIKTFGKYLYKVFFKKFPIFFENKNNVFLFLTSIDNFIHVEVKKLYPKAQTPKFSFIKEGNTLFLLYESDRPFADLAEGLIEATVENSSEKITFEVIEKNEENTMRRFKLTKHE